MWTIAFSIHSELDTKSDGPQIPNTNTSASGRTNSIDLYRKRLFIMILLSRVIKIHSICWRKSNSMACDAWHSFADLSNEKKAAKVKFLIIVHLFSRKMFFWFFKFYFFVFLPLPFQMPELSDPAVPTPSPEMAAILENLQKQKLSTSRQNVINSSSSTSSVKETSSSQQVCDARVWP